MEDKKHAREIISNLGFKKLNEMQSLAGEEILKEDAVLLLSPTGSGKTLAFLLPVFEMLKPETENVQCLILVPSRELGLQIEKVWKNMGTGFKVNICYGGHSIETEINNLSNPPAVLIGTPGRIMDHLERESFNTSEIKTLILDEFDKSLQMGFHDQMSFIIQNLDQLKKRILVSATSEVEIPRYTGVVNPKVLDFVTNADKEEKLSTELIISRDKDKIDTLFHLLCYLSSENALVFCNYREVAERISEMLNEKGIYATYYHGGMDQDERERALIMFRNGSVNYLITTDLASRGLDIPEMNNVIHYQLPHKEEEFTHRNGRTARMLSTGTAYIILSEAEEKPEYIDPSTNVRKINKSGDLPNPPQFKTIYISGGKKNKLNKIDIVGFFSKKGKLERNDLGLIEVKDFISFATVKTEKVKSLLQNIRDEKMKGKKFKIEVARNVVKKGED